MESNCSGNDQSISAPTGKSLNHQKDGVDLSVCIVTFQARHLLQDCLNSLFKHTGLNFEVIVVDNGSKDGVKEMLEEQYPQVIFIENKHNTGYTRPMNQALRQASGRYLLQLNPDTLILPNALTNLVAFMDNHKEVGICGPKVLNRDLTLQKPCRRGESTPWAVISYFTGLAKLFPNNKLFGQYLMSYIDEDEIHTVAGVAGSCMLIRRQVVDQIGFLDERFFAYQEDADYCLRARKAEWKVYYMPEAQIIHYGGMGGSRQDPYRSIFEWHRSYFQYFQKNLADNYFFILNWLYYLAMIIKLLFTLLINVFQRDKFAGSRKP
jgi:GT2 family glycosyltransferase